MARETSYGKDPSDRGSDIGEAASGTGKKLNGMRQRDRWPPTGVNDGERTSAPLPLSLDLRKGSLGNAYVVSRAMSQDESFGPEESQKVNVLSIFHTRTCLADFSTRSARNHRFAHLLM